jgi:hypothetical protein
MAYYPKNKIQQNLQTNGGEYKTIESYNNNGPFYSGYYYKLYDGKTHTGKFPGDGDNIEIIYYTFTSTPSPSVSKPLTTTDIPPLYPTPKDYEAGVFTRYFKKKRNEYLFNELTKDQYDNNVDNTLYLRFQIQWQLVGDRDATYNVNRNMVLIAEQRSNAYGLQTYLKENYLQYYK